MTVWLLYFFLAGVILFSGSRLSRYGDAIAEKTGMGGTWIGVVLMASVTSLPELMTGISSAAIYKLPDIALGDVIGSCMFNIFIFSLLDFGGTLPPLSSRAHQGQILSASFGVLLLGIVVLSILAGKTFPSIGWIGVYSVVLIFVYAVAIKIIFRYEKQRTSEFIAELAEELRYGRYSLRKIVVLYSLHATIVILAALYLPRLGERIAESTGLGQSFVGNIFIALSTSLPEFAVTASALRLGAVDMAVGNLFGSNLFNMAILAIDDFLYTNGPLLLHASGTHAITAISAICMTSIAIIGLTYRSTRRRFFFSWDSISIFIVYFLTILIFYFVT